MWETVPRRRSCVGEASLAEFNTKCPWSLIFAGTGRTQTSTGLQTFKGAQIWHAFSRNFTVYLHTPHSSADGMNHTCHISPASYQKFAAVKKCGILASILDASWPSLETKQSIWTAKRNSGTSMIVLCSAQIVCNSFQSSPRPFCHWGSLKSCLINNNSIFNWKILLK